MCQDCVDVAESKVSSKYKSSEWFTFDIFYFLSFYIYPLWSVISTCWLCVHLSWVSHLVLGVRSGQRYDWMVAGLPGVKPPGHPGHHAGHSRGALPSNHPHSGQPTVVTWHSHTIFMTAQAAAFLLTSLGSRATQHSCLLAAQTREKYYPKPHLEGEKLI